MRNILTYIVFGALVASVAPAQDLELKWDTGTTGGRFVWYGDHKWIGNDFDLATLKTQRNVITEIGVYTYPAWPNNRWDGFRIAVWQFEPQQIIWGPKFVLPDGFNAGWRWFAVNWVLPRETLSFVAAMEQTYNYPDCDPYYVDNGQPAGHSWQRDMGHWVPLGNNGNLMVRVRVRTEQEYPGIAPASVSRVKALYY